MHIFNNRGSKFKKNTWVKRNKIKLLWVNKRGSCCKIDKERKERIQNYDHNLRPLGQHDNEMKKRNKNKLK